MNYKNLLKLTLVTVICASIALAIDVVLGIDISKGNFGRVGQAIHAAIYVLWGCIIGGIVSKW